MARKMEKKNRKVRLLKHKRVIDSITGPLERRVLIWLANHMPAWVTPDTLTAVGFTGTLIVAIGFILSNQTKDMLWLTCAGFIINWFGDSLDGTLARVRHIERPRYGFFIDHSLDAMSVTLIFFSLGASPYVRFGIAAVALVGYLLLSIYTSLSTYVTAEFKISYIYLGPTEVRIIAIISCIWVYFNGTRFIHLLFGDFTFYELVTLILTVLFYLVFLLSTKNQAVHLAQVDQPQNNKNP